MSTLQINIKNCLVSVLAIVFFTSFVGLANAQEAEDKPAFAPRMDLPVFRKEILPLIDACGVKKPAKPPRLLVFWKCEGFAHAQAIEYSIAFYQVASQKGYCTVDFSGDYEALKPENLKKYDALVLSNTTGLKVKEHDLERTLLDFVRSGKGIAALHGAADNFRESPALCEMVGSLFAGHPWTWLGGEWKFKLDDPDSPINAPFGKEPFFFADEIYQHSKPYGDRNKVNVLISMDFSDETTAKMNTEIQCNKDTNDYLVSWTRKEGKGRVFYTSFGHDRAAFVHQNTMSHILLGTLFAGGTQ